MNKRPANALATKVTPRLGLIACEVLARELLASINQLPPDVAELTCLPAEWHNRPEKIAATKRRVQDLPEKLVSHLL